jgi:hypothetical protein
MDFCKDSAARTIQTKFRHKFTKGRCPLSLKTIMKEYIVVLDKQTYDANELNKYLSFSTLVPHSRRQMSDEEIHEIKRKMNPFLINNYHLRKQISNDIDYFNVKDKVVLTSKKSNFAKL